MCWNATINGPAQSRYKYRREFCEESRAHPHQKLNDLKKDERMEKEFGDQIDFPFAEEEWITVGSPEPNLSYEMPQQSFQ